MVNNIILDRKFYIYDMIRLKIYVKSFCCINSNCMYEMGELMVCFSVNFEIRLDVRFKFIQVVSVIYFEALSSFSVISCDSMDSNLSLKLWKKSSFFNLYPITQLEYLILTNLIYSQKPFNLNTSKEGKSVKLTPPNI